MFTTTYTGYVNYTKERSQVVDGSNITKRIEITKESRCIEREMFDLYNLDEPSEQLIVYNEIFSGFSADPYWNIDLNERYFPLLINTNPINYILIENDEDWNKLRANPRGNFKVIKDGTRVSAADNWIFNVDFQGILIGELPDDKKPTVIIAGLAPNKNDTAGLFKSTTGATISNISFVWDCVIEPESSCEYLTMFAGLSCTDELSLISNVDVYANDDPGETGYLLGEEATPFSRTLTGFGGLLGTSHFSSVIGCKFDASINVGLSKATDAYYVGGLVAKANGNSSDPALEGKTMAVINSFAQTRKALEYAFNLNVLEYKYGKLFRKIFKR